MPFPVEKPSLRVCLGADASAAFSVAAPVLAGSSVERLFPEAVPAATSNGRFWLFRQAGWVLGCARQAIAGDIEAATTALYGDLLAAARGRHLARIWNYVPAINEPGRGGLENYRAFSRGRSLAFQAEFGAGFKREAPASSAVGCEGGDLAVVFAAAPQRPRHIENPRQVPAYDYPPEYGPRAPTFTRASIVTDGADEYVFVSGTAAVRGHASVAPGDVRGQLLCTLDNLREMSRACGLGDTLGAGAAAPPWRRFMVYLRHAGDLPLVRSACEAELLRPGDAVTYLRSDICRRELCVEIELTLRRRGRC